VSFVSSTESHLSFGSEFSNDLGSGSGDAGGDDFTPRRVRVRAARHDEGDILDTFARQGVACVDLELHCSWVFANAPTTFASLLGIGETDGRRTIRYRCDCCPKWHDVRAPTFADSGALLLYVLDHELLHGPFPEVAFASCDLRGADT
jgi:hypothetical protein